MDAVLGPEPASGVGDTLVVEGAGDVQDSPAGLGHAEDALHHGRSRRVGFQGGPLLGPVLHHELPVAVGHPAGHPEASRGGLPHTPDNFLRKILRVELVHALDDGLHELSGGGVVGVLGDGDDPHTFAPEHGLEGDGVLPLPGEARELPDENLLEGSLRLGGLIQHPSELGPVGGASALGLVHVFTSDQVAVLLGVVPERSQLGRHGQVHVLAVAGDPSVEGRRYQIKSVTHQPLLLLSGRVPSVEFAVFPVVPACATPSPPCRGG